MALSNPNTPRSHLHPKNYHTPKSYLTPKRLCRPATETPECFSNVTVETPGTLKRRNSNSNCKEKCHKISNLTVAVRIRPMNLRELSFVGVYDATQVNGKNLVIRTNLTEHKFQYDHIFWSCDETKPHFTTQEDVFKAVGLPLLENAFRGYNACLFAYGQTGSGKSYSMMGQNNSEIIDIDVNAGVIPRFCKSLFLRISELDPNCTASVEVSYFEIYNEKIHDLLSDTSGSKQPLKVREHPVWGPYVVDLSVHRVETYKELRNFLLLGNKNRATAATAMNEKSSRSHSIFSIEISLSEGDKEEDSCRRSKVNLVDLAGSERLSGAGNEERIKQGVCINKSLLTLGKVISALAEQKKGNQFVPYRDSVLTWLLRESLGGNSLTYMLATITPSSTNIEETLSTLRYACQARSIINRAHVNENPHDRLIRELRAEVERLRALRQDYERNSFSSISNPESTLEQEQELEDLRQKLNETESKLYEAQLNWEQRFMETKQKQLKELAEAEKRKEELESHVRVLTNCNAEINLSPYRTDFLKELEGVLLEKENKEQKPSKLFVKESMNQIYGLLSNLKPNIDNNTDEKVTLTFAKANKALQAFESALINSLKDVGQKSVTFKL